MSSFKKYIAVPEDKFKALQNTNCDKIDKETVKRILKVCLLLAKINGYNESYNIRGRDGKFLDETNVIDLIEKIESEDSQIAGEDDFILLLSEANVPPELIVNERIKLKVSNLKGSLSVAPTFSSSFDVNPPKKQIEETKSIKYHDFFVSRKNVKLSPKKKTKKKPTKPKGKRRTKWIKV